MILPDLWGGSGAVRCVGLGRDLWLLRVDQKAARDARNALDYGGSGGFAANCWFDFVANQPHQDQQLWRVGSGRGLLIFSGPLTAIPMVVFLSAASRLSMTSVGLISYVNLTLQFFCAAVLFSEPLSDWHMAAFGLIWRALAFYSTATWRQEKARRKAARAAGASGTAVM